MAARAGIECRRQQALGQNHPSAQSRPIGAVGALADPVEAIAWGNHPGLVGPALQVLAKVLKHRRILGRHGGEIVESLVDPRGQAGRRDVVPKDAPIHNLSKSSGLRNHVP